MTKLGRWLAVVRKPAFLKWAAVAVALGVCAVGIYLLWGVWDGRPAAAAFTRVGGATRVETALEASRFWLTPPRFVVETPAHASQQIMVGAARCAAAHDAPLLFTSPDPQRQQLVNATINDWQQIQPAKNLAPRELMTIQRQRNILQAITLPEVIPIDNQPEMKHCLPKRHSADIAGVSTLEVPNPLIRLSRIIPARQTLAPVVVFAAAIEPGDPPDVAVGLALAEHMARANREKVSLVVVPHYLESDLELENQLQSQHELVTGGVVLGETPTVPEDTAVLLRQLLTSTDRQGVAAQVQANLGSAGSLIAALLALTGLGTAAGVAAPMVIERLERAERERPERELKKVVKKLERKERKRKERKPGRGESLPGNSISRLATSIKELIPGVLVAKESDWLIALGQNNREVTVWLRSGRQVTGTIESQIPAKGRDATVFRVKKAPLASDGTPSSRDASPRRPDGAYVLVSVKDIELIHFNDSEEPAKVT